MQKIDAFTHILPAKYLKALLEKTSFERVAGTLLARRPGIHDLDIRFRYMDRYEGYVQVLNIDIPPIEDVAEPKVAAELARIANDGMAELVMKYPDRFVAAVALLPMNNMDAALKELDRAIIELGFRGMYITSNIMDKPLDSPEFEPLFERMNYYNLPILMHPRNMQSGPRALPSEDEVGRRAQGHFNWPFETTIAMGRFVYSGMLEKYPNLKILTHHLGGLAPYQAARIFCSQGPQERAMYREHNPDWNFAKRPLDYYKMIYGDTACWGNTSALMCGYAFFGADHVLFGTDTAHGAEGGEQFVRETIRSIEEMDIPEEDKRKIFEGNANRLFHLPNEV